MSGPLDIGDGLLPALPEGARPPGSSVLLRRSRRNDPAVAVAIAVVSTAVFFGALVWAVVNAPNWPAVQRGFFDGEAFWKAMPATLSAFAINVRLFLVAEVLVLVVGLAVAVMRSLPGPVFFPLRLLAVVYADIFRGLPGLLVIAVLGLGVPALDIEGVPRDPFFWAVIALTLIYSAYVSEVYRAGIDSVHPSQEAAARSLGLSRGQALRYVIVPQAVRRVIPPLLNDFIGLQKDTVLVSFAGVVEVFRTSQIKQSASFNFTPFLATAAVFVIVTIPMARFTDWLIARDRRRQARGGFR